MAGGRRDGWRRWWVAAVEAGAAVGLVDAAVAMGRFGERLPSRRDRLAFALSLAGVSALSFAVLALAVCAVWAAAARVPARLRPAVAQAAVIAGGILLGFALFSGTAMRHSPGRPWAILATAALAALLAQAAGPALSRARFSPVARVALLFASAGLYLLHAFAYVRLYPGLHAFCAAGAVVALVTALAAGVREPVSAPVALVTLAVAAGGAAGASNLRHAQAQRALAAHRAPVAGYAVRALEAVMPGERVAPVVRDERFGNGPSLDFRGRDVVLVTVDALRADRLAPYGGRAELAPALSALATGGVVFERAYCTTPHTSYSVTALMTGKYVRELSALGAAVRPHETLARWLGEAGYATAGFFPPAVFSVDGDRLGDLPARRLDFATTEVGYADAGARVEQVARWLDTVPAGQRVFVWVHFFEPHEPYERHPGGRPVSRGDGPVDRYDGEVAAVDDAFGRLRAAFEARGRAPAWVVTADHGEEFGEHGGRFHGTTLYDEQIRVPLIVAAPHVAPARVPGPVSLVDVAPTVLAALGLPRPPRLRGRNLGPSVLAGAPSVPVFASVEHARAVVDGTEKLLCDRGGGPCELYDLVADPREVTNLVDARPARARALAALLEGWTGSHGRFDRESGAAAMDHEAEIERLLQGDASAATAVARALGSPLDPQTMRRAVDGLLALAMAGDPGPGFDRGTVADALAARLGHPDAQVRLESAVALTLLGDARGQQGALEALDRGDTATKRAAALALAAAGRADGAGVLAAWALDGAAAGRDRAARALASLRQPGSRATWETLLDDPSLSPLAAQALGEGGDPAAVPALERAAGQTRYALTLDACVRALAALHAPSAGRLLLRELTLADLAPGAMETARTLGEPGRALAGARPAGGMDVAPGRRSVLAVRGPRAAGSAYAVLEVEAHGPARLRVEGTEVSLAPGTRAVRVALRAAPRSLRLESEAPVRVRAVVVVPNRDARDPAS